MKVETKKIFGDESIAVEATCVRVPVFNCHSEAVNVEFENEISVKKARAALEKSDGILVLDRPQEMIFATPIEVSTRDEVFVSRLRKDDSVKNGLSLWVVSDNLRKGAALNAAQIAEVLVKNY